MWARPEKGLHRAKGELLPVRNRRMSPKAELSAQLSESPGTNCEIRGVACEDEPGPRAKQSRCAEARTMLAEIYGWSTEGFDTAYLKDAKALLDELSG
jgi:hypothetical protein